MCVYENDAVMRSAEISTFVKRSSVDTGRRVDASADVNLEAREVLEAAACRICFVWGFFFFFVFNQSTLLLGGIVLKSWPHGLKSQEKNERVLGCRVLPV